MLPHVRASLVVGTAIALLPTLATPSTADEPGPPGRAAAERVLAQVQQALAPKERTDRQTPLPRADLTMQLRDLRRALPALRPAGRATAERLLSTSARSQASCSGGLFGQVVRTAHFCVRYTASTTASWATTTATTLENVWSREVGTLGFRPPPPDGDGLFDVTLEQLGNRGLYGYCAPDENAAHSSSSCVLDNDYAANEYGAPPINSLRATAAHEFFHAIQFGYDTGEDLWFMEGSAVWAEEQVFPTVNDYLQYLPYSPIARPRTPADYDGDSGADVLHRYGAVVFWTFLSERFRTPAVVRRVWELADGVTTSRYSTQAVAAALAERGWSFPQAFGTFGVWNTKAPGTYADRALFPAVPYWQSSKLNRRKRDTGTRGIALDHLTNAAMHLRPGAKLPPRTKLRVTVDAPALARMPRAMVQVRRRDGGLSVDTVVLNASGDGRLTVGFDPRRVAAVVVTLTNASTRMTGCTTGLASTSYACGGRSVDDDLVFTTRARVRLP